MPFESSTVEAISGMVLWVHRVGVTVVNTPMIVDNRRLLVTDLDGSLTLLDHAQ